MSGESTEEDGFRCKQKFRSLLHDSATAQTAALSDAMVLIKNSLQQSHTCKVCTCCQLWFNTLSLGST